MRGRVNNTFSKLAMVKGQWQRQMISEHHGVRRISRAPQPRDLGIGVRGDFLAGASSKYSYEMR